MKRPTILNKKTNREVRIGSQAFRRAIREDQIDLVKLKELGYDLKGKPVVVEEVKEVEPKKIYQGVGAVLAKDFLISAGITKLPDCLHKEDLKKMTISEFHNYIYS